MKKEDPENYTFRFESAETPKKIFETLLDVRQWWTGLYGEDIQGTSAELNDEFSFSAGDGIHYSRQRLIELVPEKNIFWQVTESNLSFAEKTDEWTDTKFGFEISVQGKKSVITFSHQGLIPRFECFRNCSDAWTQYLKKLEKRLTL